MPKLKQLREPLNTTTNRIVVLVLAVGFVIALVVTVVQVTHDKARACAPLRGFITNDFDGPNLKMLSPGTTAYGTDSEVCTMSPTGGQTLAHLLVYVPMLLFMIGSAVLLARFLWGAAQPGPHSKVSPGRLRALGWFLTIGGPASALLGHLGEHLLRNSMLRNPLPLSVYEQEWQHDFPWWYVFSGLVALLLSRMLRIDVRMSEDLEGTV